MVPGSTFTYGSSFWKATRRPRDLNSRPSEAVMIPCPTLADIGRERQDRRDQDAGHARREPKGHAGHEGGAPREQEELQGPAGTDVEPVPQVRAGREQDGASQAGGAGVDELGRHHDDRAPRADHQLEDARGHVARCHRPQVRAKPAGARRHEVVHQPGDEHQEASTERDPCGGIERSALAGHDGQSGEQPGHRPGSDGRQPEGHGEPLAPIVLRPEAFPSAHRSPRARGRTASTTSTPCRPRWANPPSPRPVARWSRSARTSTTRYPRRTASIVIPVSTPNPADRGRHASSASWVSARCPESGSTGWNPLSRRMARPADRFTSPNPPACAGGRMATARSARPSSTSDRTAPSWPAVWPRSASARSQTPAGGSRRSAPSRARPLPARRRPWMTVAPAARAAEAVPSVEASSTTTTSSTPGRERRAETVAPMRSASLRAAMSAQTLRAVT